MSKSKPNEDVRDADIFTKCRIWKQTMDGCEISINSCMLDPQYTIPSTLPYSSRLIKSASKRGKTQEQEPIGICSHIISTRSAPKVLHLHICMYAAFGEIPGHAAALSHPPQVSVKKKSRWEGHCISPLWVLLFPLLFTMYLCAVSGPLDRSRLCALVGRTKAQAESEEAHMHSSDANPVLAISSLIPADRSEILHRLKVVNPQGIFFPSKLLSNALTDSYRDFCCFSDLI